MVIPLTYVLKFVFHFGMSFITYLTKTPSFYFFFFLFFLSSLFSSYLSLPFLYNFFFGIFTNSAFVKSWKKKSYAKKWPAKPTPLIHLCQFLQNGGASSIPFFKISKPRIMLSFASSSLLRTSLHFHASSHQPVPMSRRSITPFRRKVFCCSTATKFDVISQSFFLLSLQSNLMQL